ncbi:MAG: dihydrodipicolinate synthase family protein [Rhodovibrionaceae bacterium]|nr:dihydrodipicolinate synthase family protein [Rhodovibrionaceae bacterium]
MSPTPRAEAFSGVLTPVLTPFAADGAVDARGFVAHCRWLLAEGGDGLAIFGTTSEANSLALDEKLALLDRLVEAGVPGEKLMPGTGCCALPETVRLTRAAVEAGAGGVLLLPPFYYKAVSDEGLFRSLAETIEAVSDSRLRVYLYHIPPVAQVGWSLPLVERALKAFPDTVVGLKDSSGDWSNTKALLDAFPGLDVFPGSEVFLLDGLKAGAAGCITATANVNLRAIRRVYEAWQAGDEQVEGLQAEVTDFRKKLQAHPMIPALKAVLAAYRGPESWAVPRPPLLPLPAPDAKELMATLRALDFRLERQHAPAS